MEKTQRQRSLYLTNKRLRQINVARNNTRTPDEIRDFAGSRVCCECQLEKEATAFGICRGHKHGLVYKCNECRAQDRLEQRANDPHKMWALRAWWNHQQKYEMKVTIEEVTEMGRRTTQCHLCGEELRWGMHGRSSDQSPSLDRINNTFVLTEEDLWVICNLCNRTKSNRTLDEFIAYCRMISEKIGG